MTTATNQLALGDVARDEAIERVASHNEEFMACAWTTILMLKETGRPFTADEVWWGSLVKPTDPRAMGAALKKAKDAGLIRPTGVWRKCTRASRHSAPVREWEAVR